MDVLTRYQPEEQYYPPGVDVNLYLYGSTNYIWNPMCCDQIEGDSAITTDRVYTIMMAYKSIQFLLVIAIALIFSQVFISGMFLNFLIFNPYFRARLIKGGRS